MKKHRHGAAAAASPSVLAERGAEALRLGRFKEAVKVFKQLIRQHPQPQWTDRLADAYAGRARAVADKKMFQEPRSCSRTRARRTAPYAIRCSI